MRFPGDLRWPEEVRALPKASGEPQEASAKVSRSAQKRLQERRKLSPRRDQEGPSGHQERLNAAPDANRLHRTKDVILMTLSTFFFSVVRVFRNATKEKKEKCRNGATRKQIKTSFQDVNGAAAATPNPNIQGRGAKF